MKLLRRIRLLFRKDKLDGQMAEEMRAHEAREPRGWVWLEQIWQDGQQAVRALASQPGFTAVAVLTLALGLALVTLQFSFINGTLLNGLAFPRVDRLFRVDGLQHDDVHPLSQGAFEVLQSRQRSFDGLGAYAREDVNLSAPEGETRRYQGLAISANLLPVLGIRPMVGRGIGPDDERPDAARVVLLGERVWDRDFGRDRAAIGRTVRLNGETATIIGVMPAWFGFPNAQQVWTNLRSVVAVNRRVWLVGRLQEDVTVEAARAELQRLLLAFGPPEEKNPELRVWQLRDATMDDGFSDTMLVMLALATGALLLAAVNAANLLLLRAVRRAPELALRAALGASRGRLVRQILAEAVVLAIGGAVLGWLLTVGAASPINQQLHADGATPYWIRLQVDHRIVGACLLLALVLGALCGLAPALRATRFGSLARLGDGTQFTAGLAYSRFRRMVVTFQLGLACSLLMVTALFVKGSLQLPQADLRFDAAQTLSAKLTLQGSYDLPTDASRIQFGAELLARLRTLPAVAGVTFSSRHPADQGMGAPVEPEGRPAAGWDAATWAFQETVAPGFFGALGIPLQAGSDFGAREAQPGRPGVVIVSASLAQQLWPGESAIGKRLRDLPWPGAPGQATPWLTVVGVAPDLPLRGALKPRLTPGYYVPFGQRMPSQITVLARTTGGPSLLAKPLRQVVGALAPDVPVEGLQTVQARITERWGFMRAIGLLALAFGLGALFLAATGIYSTVAFGVQKRTREFGVRLALGATRRNILLLLLRQTSAQLLVGVSGGVVVGWAANRLIVHSGARMIAALDPLHSALVLGVVSLATVLAVALPARRATKVNPVEALRSE